MNDKISFSYRELRFIQSLVKDRKFKVEMGNLKYSQHFLNVEKQITQHLQEKLDKILQTVFSNEKIEEKAVV